MFFAVLAAVVAWWTWRALHDAHGYDFRLAYTGGQVAWATGHPEQQSTWTGTPLLAAALALLTRVQSLRTAADALTVVNVLLVIGATAVLMGRLRSRLSPAWWWVTALALLSFGPMLSTVWWKQFNIIALVLAAAGFDLLRRRHRPSSAAALIGLSLAIKPLVLLLPVVLLVRRETRRFGALSLLWAAGSTMAAQGFLAVRAHDFGALSPISAINNFAHKTQPSFHPRWVCMPLNFAPGSLLCRLAGTSGWMLQHIVIWVAVTILGILIILALRGQPATSWELFAFVCPLSAMLSPLAWSHYQILLVPLFVLLIVRFTTDGASVIAWTGLAAAFVLSSLMWEPYGTWITSLTTLAQAHPASVARSLDDAASVASFAQHAQYILLATAIIWYGGRSTPGAQSGRRDRRRASTAPSSTPSLDSGTTLSI